MALVTHFTNPPSHTKVTEKTSRYWGQHMTANEKLSREEQLIAYFVTRCSGHLGRTQLVKFLYLADYEARRYLGKPLSGFQYFWHHYGPFDHAIYENLENLKTRGFVDEESILFPTGKV